jgi:heavy metal sensor kinase
MFRSIKLRLVIWSLVIFSVVFTGLEIYLYYELEDVAISFVDEHLRSEVHVLANLLSVEDEQGHLEYELYELSQAEVGEYARELSGQYFQIVSADGIILARSPSLALADASLPFVKAGLEPVYEIITGPNNEPLRVIGQTFDFSIGTLTFQAGDSLENTYKILGSFRRVIIIIYPVVFLVCAIGLFMLTGWALGPLKVFSSKVGRITEENLSERVDERGFGAELRPLAEGFNTMLGRLDTSFARQKQFLSDASHELRTPTTIIKSFCDVTLRRDRDEQEYKEALVKIGAAVNRMSEIINRILVISRLDSGTIRFKPVSIDLKDMLGDVMRLISISAADKGIEVRLDGSDISIRGDREGLTEVFTNIVENALKYNKDGGRVDIHLASGDGGGAGGAVVTVKDTGIGIPGEKIDKIFDRFYRVDSSRELTVGSGLGLSIVRTIVEAHGGTIEVESAPDKGSTFRVRLPGEPAFIKDNG